MDPSSQSVLRTLLLSDLVGSTRLVEELGDRRVAELFSRHDRLARDLLAEHDGREIDKTDGFLMLFGRPLQALRYAIGYHQGLAELGREEGVELASRVGIHLGEVFLRQNPPEDVARGAKPLEVEGLAKPMAARLMSLAGGRQTLLTQGAFDLARRAAVGDESLTETLRWLAHGGYLFQGLEESVGVFEVGLEGFSPLAPPPDSAKVKPAAGDDAILGWRPAAGQEIPARHHWELSEKLGEGGFGEVWLARHRKTGDRRVFKFCFDAQRLRGLQREITLFRLLKEELGDRDDIVRILDWSFEGVPYFIESEYTAGGSLIDWLEAEGGIAGVPLLRRLEVVAQVAEALSAAHSVGVLHKDIKPGNVLIHIDAKGRVQARLADFGIGGVTDTERLAAAGITVLGMTRMAGAAELASTTGTQLYHAPELIEGKAATVQADVYALGVMLYQMVVGDLRRAMGPGWERGVEDELLREDIALLVDVDPRRRLGNALRLAERLRTLEERRSQREADRRAREEAEAAARRRKLLTTVAAVSTVFLLIVSALAFQAVRARAQAEQQTRRAEAQKLLALGQVEIDAHPSAALAWARASLEVMETPAGRLFALQALSRGPAVRSIPSFIGVVHSVSFSPDGEWAALEGYESLKIQHRLGGNETSVDVFPAGGSSAVHGIFDAASSQLTAWKPYFALDAQEVRSYSMPELSQDDRRELAAGLGVSSRTVENVSRTVEEIGEIVGWSLTRQGIYMWGPVSDGLEVRRWRAEEPPRTLGRIEACNGVREVDDPVSNHHRADLGVDAVQIQTTPSGDWLACWRGQKVYLHSLENLEDPPRKVLTLAEPIRRLRLHPDLEWIAVQVQGTDTITGWPLTDDASEPLWSCQARGLLLLEVDPTGSRIAEAGMVDGVATAFIWDLGLPGAEPLRLRYPNQRYLSNISFDPSGRWLAMGNVGDASFWPLPTQFPKVYSGGGGAFRAPAFMPDGESLVTVEGWSGKQKVVRLRPLVEGAAERVLPTEFRGLSRIRMDPEGRFLVGAGDPDVMVLPFDGSEPIRLEGFGSAASLRAVAYNADRELVAAAPNKGPKDQKVIRVWSLRDGSVRVLEADGAGDGFIGGYDDLDFLPDGRLLSCGANGVRRWSLEDGSFETLLYKPCGDLVIAPGGRVAVAARRPRPSLLRDLLMVPWAIDLDTGEVRQLEGFRPSGTLAVAPRGDIVAAASAGGVIQVGRLSGGEPHYLFGLEAPVTTLAFSPDGRQLASAHEGGTLRVWPVPDLSDPPFHTLPFDELLARLDSVTNFRVVPDAESATGYSLIVDDFPGWADVPQW